MFSLHLPKLTAAVAEHVPLENHKQAGCQLCRALWTEACQGLVSKRTLPCLSWPRAHDSPRLQFQPAGLGLSQALPADPCCQPLKRAWCDDGPLDVDEHARLLMEGSTWKRSGQPGTNKMEANGVLTFSQSSAGEPAAHIESRAKPLEPSRSAMGICQKEVKRKLLRN